jgi:transcriptional pleiotropic regulator of transition state genes
MKATGAYRRLDTLGRLVLPAELRRHTALDSGTAVTFLIDGNHLVLRANESGCVFCGSGEDIMRFAGHLVCRRCIAAMPRGAAAD